MKKALAFALVAFLAGCCAGEPKQAPESHVAAPASGEEKPDFSGLGRLLGGPPVPAIDARVAAVSGDSPALVLISVGSDDRVERGFRFSVYRGNEFVGMVVVEKVLKDSCGCRTLFTKEGFAIEAGDQAATRLQ